MQAPLLYIKKCLTVLVSFLVFGISPAQAEVPLLPIPGIAAVVDPARALKKSEIDALTKKLEAIEARTDAQVAILLVPTIAPEGMSQYVLRTMQARHLGGKQVDKGILIVASFKDRALRIEVGRGLKPLVSNTLADQIVEQTLVPAFKRARYYQGIDSSVEQLSALLDGKPLPVVQKKSFFLKGPSEYWVLWGIILTILLVKMLLALRARIRTQNQDTPQLRGSLLNSDPVDVPIQKPSKNQFEGFF